MTQAVPEATLVITTGVYAPEEFLELLTKGQKDTEGERGRLYAFRPQVDVVIVGPGRETFARPYDTSSLGLLFGEDYSWFESPYKPYLQSFMGEDPHAAVLLLSNAGGNYRQSFIKAVRAGFPRVNWITPYIRDYARQPWPHLVLDDLHGSGLISLQF